MKRIALTGSFATGKSTVAKMFEALGIPCLDADTIAHQLTLPDEPAWLEIVAAFGESILKKDRTIDRKKLSDIVFQTPPHLHQLESILHPKVREKMDQEIARLESRGEAAVLLEIPLLFEVKWDEDEAWEAILVVVTTPEKQMEQAKKKFNLTEEEVFARIRAQLPLEEKAKRADYVIDNSGDLEKTKTQVQSIFKQLTASLFN